MIFIEFLCPVSFLAACWESKAFSRHGLALKLYFVVRHPLDFATSFLAHLGLDSHVAFAEQHFLWVPGRFPRHFTAGKQAYLDTAMNGLRYSGYVDAVIQRWALVDFVSDPVGETRKLAEALGFSGPWDEARSQRKIRKGHQRMDQIRAVIRAKLEEWKLGMGNMIELPSTGSNEQSCMAAIAAVDAVETQPMEWTDSLVEDNLSPVRPMQPLEDGEASNGPLKRTMPLEGDNSSESSTESAEEESSTSDESVDPVECHVPYIICLESDEEDTVLSPKKTEPKPDSYPATTPSGSSAAAARAPELDEMKGNADAFSPEVQDSQVAGDVMEGDFCMENIVSDEDAEGCEASTQKGVFKDSYFCFL
eukprot:s1285_g10.t1